MNKFKVGDIFVATRNFPEDIEEDVKDEMASFDIVEGEKFEIKKITPYGYEIYNHNLGQWTWCMMSEQELINTIHKINQP